MQRRIPSKVHYLLSWLGRSMMSLEKFHVVAVSRGLKDVRRDGKNGFVGVRVTQFEYSARSG